ncbi:hypothetical protein BDY17DRAFT_324362 [Neohortaea acidophila]|uniref:DHHA2 domain-containing protein n=1 Tax=Neohortaea acidophila TaxID=245834 RepID=A0A6A6PV89_9PEZI|nr:uncharacterized protein BDY17DRAFT_324362 [Neohortaea acidophila]KAF2483644.1 hypothetical protein BDY17DRAFT_324362 [Neohortaea acidophila]
MSRASLRLFLSNAKRHVSQCLSGGGEHHLSFVIGNQSADLDSITCALVYGYLQSFTAQTAKTQGYIIPITNIPSRDLRLRPELTALLKNVNLKPSDLITLDDLGNLHESLPSDRTDWTLVDHNALLGELGKHYSKRVKAVIDHHDDEKAVPQDASPRIIEKSGSCCSLVVNSFRNVWDSASTSSTDTRTGDIEPEEADAQVALLSLGPILIDTVNLRSEDKTTPHDRQAVDYLESKINSSRKLHQTYERDAFYNQLNDAKSNLDALTLPEILEKDYKEWHEGDLTLGISSSVKSIKYLMDKDANFTNVLLEFAKGKKLDLFAVMTAHNESDSFARQLLLLAVSENKAIDVAEKFVTANQGDLKLEENDPGLEASGSKWIKIWQQGNLAASRKKVAPALRKVM